MRTPRALILLAFLLVGPSLAPTAAGATPETDLPAPRAGDAGTYGVVDPLPLGEDGGDAVIGFELGGPQLMDDAYGTDRAAMPLTLAPDPVAEPQGPIGRAWQPWTSWMVHRGTGPIATDRPAPPHHGFSFTAGPLGDADDDGPRARGQLRYAHQARALDGPACWLLAGPEPGPMSPQMPATFAPCGRDLVEAAAGNGTQLTIAAGPITPLTDGTHQRTLTVTATGTQVQAELALTYRSGIPVPTRIHLEAQHTAGFADPDAFHFIWDELVRPIDLLARGPTPGDRVPGHQGEPIAATLELTRFQRGDGPRLTDGPPITWPGARDSLHRAPLTRWGPKSGGETFDLSREEAQRSIQNDPTLSEFHTWLDEHPDARAILTSHRVLDGGQREGWSFWFVAPDRTAWGLRSEQPADTGLEVVGPVEGTALVNRAQRMDQFPPCTEACTFSVTPSIDRIPTIRSALEVWQQEASLSASGSTPSAYVWVMSPWFGEMRIAAGWSPAPQTASPLGPLTADGQAHGSNASAILLSPYDGALTERQGLEPHPLPDPVPASATVAPAVPATATPAWRSVALVAAGLAVLVAGVRLHRR